MSSKRPPKREHKLIAFKAFFDTDRDILEWWEGMQDGERSEVIRELLRGYVKGLPLYEATRRPAVAVDGSVVLQLRDDTAWIRGALNEMPAYLEGLLGRISVYTPPAVQSEPREMQRTDNLSNDALARRKAKMGKVGW
ncbi:MAG: hypothetical protein J0M07_31225 [Anaerolineae bacterium]|nr:hypothetical protein [Anaerolineae bacterium]